GLGGAQERYGVVPDLACYGKVIGGGYPLSAVAGSRALVELTAHARAGRDDFVYMSGTLNGNPVAATAGLKTIEILEREGSFERLFGVGDAAREGVRAGLAEAGVAAQVVGTGPLFQVLVTPEPIVDYRAMLGADETRAQQIAAGAVERGVFTTGF